jgi:hypothetical protein
MSTNDAGWGSPGLPPNLPDPEVLARLAAEFFGSFPGTAATGQTLAAIPQEPPGAPHHVSLPGDLGKPPVGASPGPPVANEISPPAAVPVPQPTVPAIPGSGTALASSALSGFSSVEQARPLFGASHAAEPGALPSGPAQPGPPKQPDRTLQHVRGPRRSGSGLTASAVGPP